MKGFITVLLISAMSSFATAQSLPVLKEQYDQLSPLKGPSIDQSQVIKPDESLTSSLEDQMESAKAQEHEAKQAHTEKVYLDTDYQFFQSLAVPEEYDELDEATKKDQLAQAIEQNVMASQAVRSEIKTAAPKNFSLRQGYAMDYRRTLILKKVAKNSRYVRACIHRFKKPDVAFKGTSMTVSWEVVSSGKVENARMKNTDVENTEIQDCVLKALAAWDFKDVAKPNGKRSRIEYTYRFVSPSPQPTTTVSSTQAQN